MDLQSAIATVADDVRAGYPDMTDAEAIAHVRQVITMYDINGWDTVARAYRVVLRATDSELSAHI